MEDYIRGPTPDADLDSTSKGNGTDRLSTEHIGHKDRRLGATFSDL